MKSITEVKDLLGNELKVGDKVVFGSTTSSYNACVNTGVIKKINKDLLFLAKQIKIIEERTIKMITISNI